MKLYWTLTGVAALLFLLPAIDFAIGSMFGVYALVLFPLLKTNLASAIFFVLSGTLYLIIPIGMLLAHSFKRLNLYSKANWTLFITIAITCVVITGYQLTTETYIPWYSRFIPFWFIELLVPGYHLM